MAKKYDPILFDVVMRSICAEAEANLVPCHDCGCRKPKARFGTECAFYDRRFGHAKIECGGCGNYVSEATMPEAVRVWNQCNNIKDAE